MSSQSNTAGDKHKEENMAMKDAAAGDEKTTQKAKAKDDDSKKEQKIGQKATTYASIKTPVLEDDDDKVLAKPSGKASGLAGQDDAAKTSGKASGIAGKDDAAKTSGKAVGKAGKDDAAKNLGKTVGEAGQDAHDDDPKEDAFVSPEDVSKDRWEARVQALEEEDRRRKVGDAHAFF